MWAEADIGPRELGRFWTAVAEEAFGVGAQAELAPLCEGAYEVGAVADGAPFRLACVGEASSLARALLGIEDSDAPTWAFTVDVDAVAVAAHGLAGRAELYDPTMTFLRRFEDASSSLGAPHRRRACNLLRGLGFAEFHGLDVYEADCYRKMNMIQESWDANNRGVQLAEPLGAFSGLPTVLTPALEEALAANYRAGEEACRLFELRRIFLPAADGGLPIEKTALSLGGYGPDLGKKEWKALVDGFLAAFGISNRFYIPTDRAIAYDTGDCWLVMDERMRYLEGNFGSISPIALENHGIEAPAFMAQFEFEALEAKADEELAFTPPENR
ncbi:hypothetical protein [Arabiibacter massiliensis]|uniref:hypothetical protein n=1 Tax=Arabiibacter massiliensis TaxID=1870985 RepID=UPI0009BB3E7A|nr:hypothetical protein [Arabiibacter massiliensis]